MKKIDLYILKKFLSTFFFCLLLLTVIVVVVDISEKTDDFVRSNLSTKQIIVDYYFGFIPRIDAMLFPLFVFIAVIFFTSKMAGRSEIIAILSSGTSYRRFILPYVVGSVFLAAILWGGYQYAVPRANRVWGDFEKKYIDVNKGAANTNSSYKENIYFRLDSNSYVGIKNYDTISKTGYGFFVDRFKKNQLIYNLRSTNFSWDTAAKKWNLTNVTERIFQEKTETVKRHDTLKVAYNFKPIDLRKDEYLKDQMPTPELNLSLIHI